MLIIVGQELCSSSTATVNQWKFLQTTKVSKNLGSKEPIQNWFFAKPRKMEDTRDGSGSRWNRAKISLIGLNKFLRACMLSYHICINTRRKCENTLSLLMWTSNSCFFLYQVGFFGRNFCLSLDVFLLLEIIKMNVRVSISNFYWIYTLGELFLFNCCNTWSSESNVGRHGLWI